MLVLVLNSNNFSENMWRPKIRRIMLEVMEWTMNHPQQEKTDKHKVDEWIYTTTTMELNQVT